MSGRTIATISRSRSTATCRRKSSRRPWNGSTGSPPTSARRRRCASSGPRGRGEAEEILRATTKIERHRPKLAHEQRTRSSRRSRCGSSRHSPGSGIAFAMDVDVRLVPLYIFRTVESMTRQMESYVREALAEGLSGWPVTDCRVTLTDCGYRSPETSAADFRKLTQLVLFDRSGSRRHVGLRTALESRARGADGQCAWGPGGARASRRPGPGAVLGGRSVAGRRGPAGRPTPRAAAADVRSHGG